MLRVLAERQAELREGLRKEHSLYGPPEALIVNGQMPLVAQKRTFRFVGSRGKKSDANMKRFSYLPSRGRRSV
ncbi:hypothetical protein L596_015007 [Steinernema carpocapsae]|uniref:Uncharacterized protein n=1 Tax=Steinernema carpocapsae TaxID=34508 RepID=A0A4U5NDN5_STECR|nr:hypothetical protein L596_015007 [Steinernema carpocapsae]